MQLTSPSRRALGLAAAGVLSLSTLVIGLPGTATAETLEIIAFDADETGSVEVPLTGYCAVDWWVVGGSGGAGQEDGAAVPGTAGGEIRGTSAVTGGEIFSFSAGTVGADADVDGGGAGGTNAEEPDLDGGAGGTVHDADDLAVGGGGGGGAASVVTGPEGFSLIAYGGDGGGDHGGLGAGEGANVVDADLTDLVDGAYDAVGFHGRIEGQILPCAPEEEVVLTAPLAPTGLSAVDGDGRVTVRFDPTWSEDENGTDADAWEYSLDGVHYEPADVAWDEAYRKEAFTLIGLTNGTTYSIRVRGVSDLAGHGTPSEPVTSRPFVAPGAPGGVTVTPGTASVRVGWSAASSAGTYGIHHYAVDLIMSGGEMGDRSTVCEVPAGAPLTCLVGLRTEAGYTYRIVVSAVDGVGHSGADSAVVPVGTPSAPSVPATVPTSNGDLTRPAGQSGSVAAGSAVEISGSGYLPGSTVSLIVYSTPQVVGSAVADENGRFTATVTLPAGLTSGAHTLVASGVDPSGNPRYLTLPVTVTGGTATAATTGGLAYTGASVALPALGGLAALALGGALVVAGRRTRA
ncbi:fibronectin type III domain-containing protein [Geodermatophilus normandii]|uniref:Fibronectin type III domain-containing protein n=1 Tax=Geodermatophilus normandii TaxID=1137989 RepID=A0A6P0GF17_9ACTN|nr:fibronectin type III domain-containing protein [Geodermatophilus normandii]NEM05846.1 fibronectin type III domain-containing protein [Geodermatophilus normandii]